MNRLARLLLLPLGLLAAAVTLPGATLAAPSASIEQVRNGLATATTTPTPTWGTGNAGASNSHYLESHSIAYRAVMDNLPTDGTVIEMVIGYDVKRSGSYALDYLTQYQRLLPHVLFGHRDPEVFDPLAGLSGVGPLVTTAPIPVPTSNVSIDPDGAGPEPAALQPVTNASALTGAERLMTLYGGTLIDVTYDTEADVNLATASSESRVKVRFTANSPKAVLAWGGHIACRWDWGFNADGSPRSAGGISGSSYHMRLVGWNLGSLGNQDRSMSTDAVYPVPQCGATNLGPFCANTVNTHTAPAGMESYSWALLDDTSGAFFVGGTTGTSVIVNSGPNGGSYRIAVTTTASGFAKTCDDVVTVLAPAVADAGADQTVCAASPQVTLGGVASGGTALWSGGAGTFAPNASTLNAVYTPTAAEIAAGGVTLTLKATPAGSCPAVSDAMRITITPVATANAGADRTLCASAPQVTLAGSVGGGASSGTWSGGGGSFAPSASALNAVYTPTAGEIAAGSVTLTLTSNDPAGPCDAASDAMTVSFLPAATADAGADLEVCSTAAQAQLAGAIGGGAASGTWSGGAGSFAPNASALNAVYTPSAAEIAAGSVTLTLTTNDPAGPCGAVTDQVVVTIRPAAVANAGLDQTLCSSSPQVTLAGTVAGGAGSGSWSGGAGSYSPNASSLNAVYTPTAAEIAAGGVTLTLTTNDPAGPCGPGSDQVRITIAPAATANAGVDRRVCAGAPQVALAGVVGGGATSGTWSGGAGSFSPGATTLGATYTPSAAEIAAGRVTLTLTTNDPAGPCGAVSDAMTITIDPVTSVYAGLDQTVCASAPQVTLAGNVTGTVTLGTWTGGTGTFSPSASSLNAVYTPSAAEIAAGQVTLTLTSATPSGPCSAASDAMTIFIRPVATANAGPDVTTCATSPSVRLAASLGGAATSGAWTGGFGIFSPNANTANALYTPTAGEIGAGNVTLTWTSNDPAGPCGAASDQMTIVFDAPIVTVANTVVCTDVSPVTLCANPSKGVAPYTYRWSTGAISQCITVSDTGSYAVTITDAKGCVASTTGHFGQRECIGQLTHTTATCSSFMDGTAPDFSSGDVNIVLRDGVISSISPGVFFYWTKVKAPSSDFTIQVVQAKDNPAFPFLPVLQGQASPYDANCTRLASGDETSPGQATIPVTGAVPGKVYIVSVKYSLKALVGVAMPAGSGAHYDFRTLMNGVIVDSDPEGLQIGAVQVPVAGGTGTPLTGSEDPNGTPSDPGMKLPGHASLAASGSETAGTVEFLAYRPMPNPFRSGMRMAYSVAGPAQRVNIRVVDVAGRVVRTLVDAMEPAGSHVTSWDGRDRDGVKMRNGIYFIHASVGTETRFVRVTMLQ